MGGLNKLSFNAVLIFHCFIFSITEKKRDNEFTAHTKLCVPLLKLYNSVLKFFHLKATLNENPT